MTANWCGCFIVLYKGSQKLPGTRSLSCFFFFFLLASVVLIAGIPEHCYYIQFLSSYGRMRTHCVHMERFPLSIGFFALIPQEWFPLSVFNLLALLRSLPFFTLVRVRLGSFHTLYNYSHLQAALKLSWPDHVSETGSLLISRITSIVIASSSLMASENTLFSFRFFCYIWVGVGFCFFLLFVAFGNRESWPASCTLLSLILGSAHNGSSFAFLHSSW